MNKYMIELLGTFFLILIIGLSADFIAIGFGPIAIGFGLAALVYMGGHISGAHYNPAVSLAMLIRGKINFKVCIFYIFSQILGAILASLAIAIISGNNFEVIADKDTLKTQFILAEFIFTYLLVFVIETIVTIIYK